MPNAAHDLFMLNAANPPVAGTSHDPVRDSSGGGIPGATVHAVNEANNATRDGVTDGQGAYRLDGLAAGVVGSLALGAIASSQSRTIGWTMSPPCMIRSQSLKASTTSGHSVRWSLG